VIKAEIENRSDNEFENRKKYCKNLFNYFSSAVIFIIEKIPIKNYASTWTSTKVRVYAVYFDMFRTFG